jgi:hypothetical protein
MSGVLSNLKNIVTFIPNLFGNLYNNIKNFFGSLDMSGVLSNLKNIVTFIPNLFGNLYNNIKNFFGSLDTSGVLSNLKNIVMFVPNMFKQMLQYVLNFFNPESLYKNIVKTIETVFYATPIGMLIKGAGEIIKYFSEFGIVESIKKIGDDIKNKFLGIFDFVSNIISKIFSYVKDKVKNIPLIGKYLVSDEKPEESKLAKQAESKQVPATINVSGPAAIEQQVQQPINFNTENLQETVKPKFETSDMFSQENPKNVYAMEKGTMEPQSFNKFKVELEGLNKNSNVNSKIAVDQLREIKNLNGRIQELAQMMLANRTLTVNNVSNKSVNAFIHPSTVNNFRSNYRE